MGSTAKKTRIYAAKGGFLPLCEPPRADRLYSGDLPGGLTFYTGNGGGLALGSGDLLVVSSGF